MTALDDVKAAVGAASDADILQAIKTTWSGYRGSQFFVYEDPTNTTEWTDVASATMYAGMIKDLTINSVAAIYPPSTGGTGLPPGFEDNLNTRLSGIDGQISGLGDDLVDLDAEITSINSRTPVMLAQSGETRPNADLVIWRDVPFVSAAAVDGDLMVWRENGRVSRRYNNAWQPTDEVGRVSYSAGSSNMARPAGYTHVIWYGLVGSAAVFPTNAANGDLRLCWDDSSLWVKSPSGWGKAGLPAPSTDGKILTSLSGAWVEADLPVPEEGIDPSLVQTTVNHGSNSLEARPSGRGPGVMWFGSVFPTNAIEGDTMFAAGVNHLYVRTAGGWRRLTSDSNGYELPSPIISGNAGGSNTLSATSEVTICPPITVVNPHPTQALHVTAVASIIGIAGGGSQNRYTIDNCYYKSSNAAIDSRNYGAHIGNMSNLTVTFFAAGSVAAGSSKVFDLRGWRTSANGTYYNTALLITPVRFE